MIGIIAGNAVLLIFSFWIHNVEFFVPYAAFAIPGWILVGIPVALAFPARLVTGAWWPIVCLAIGPALGPVTLQVIFIVLSALEGDFRNFSLAHTGWDYLLSIAASTVSFVVYAALLRKRLLEQQHDWEAGA